MPAFKVKGTGMAEDDMKSRLFGRSATRTVIQLVVASIIVGAIFSFIGVGPREFWRGIITAIRDLVRNLGESFGEIALTLGTYLFIGAAIVIPIWLLIRLWSGRK